MSPWFARVEELLFEGESVETKIDIGEGGLVVTSHRVLAFTSDDGGANYEYVDRPNVTGVKRATRGTASYLTPAVKALIVGAVLVAAGQVVSLDDLVGGIELSTTGGMGLGGFLGLMQSLLGILAMLDEIMTAVGALALLFGAGLLGIYAWSRADLLVIEVAGDDDIELPAADTDDGLAERLSRAVQSAGSNDEDGRQEDTQDPFS